MKKSFMKTTIATSIVLSSTFISALANAGGSADTRGLSIEFFNKGETSQSSKDVKISEQAIGGLPSQVTANSNVLGGFNLNSISFKGNTVFSNQELLALVSRYLGTRVIASDLEDIRVALSQHYVMQGYINSGAVLPDQNINDGNVRFDIIEGQVSQVNIAGSGRLADSYIKRQLLDDKPFNKNDLQEKFQLLLDDPLFETMSATLRPAANKGEAILDLAVERARPYGLDISYDNHRPVATGDMQTRVSGWARNLSGFGDLLEVAAISREGSDGYDVRYQIPIGFGGTTIGFSVAEGDSDVIEASVKVLDIKSDYKASSVFLNKDLMKDINGHLTLGVELSSREVTNELLGLPWSFSLGENDGFAKAVAARLNVDYLKKSAADVLSIRGTFSQGLDSMDSTQNDDGRPDSDFSSALLQMQYARMLNEKGLQLQLRASYQWANEALLPLEQVAIGGVNTVRGYRENELVRDKGLLASAQLVYPLTDTSYSLGRWNALVFADYGKAENVNPTPSQTFDQMYSVGFGLQWRYKERVSADLYVAHALEDAPVKSESNLQDDGIHFRISVAAF